MEAKEYLSQVFYIDKFIRSDKEEIERLTHLLVSPKGINYGERIQCSPTGDKMSILLDKIDDAKKDLQRDVDRYLKLRDAIKETIGKVSEENIQLVLRLRYLELLKWNEIADRLECTFQWSHELHKKGLVEVQVILDKADSIMVLEKNL